MGVLQEWRVEPILITFCFWAHPTPEKNAQDQSIGNHQGTGPEWVLRLQIIQMDTFTLEANLAMKTLYFQWANHQTKWLIFHCLVGLYQIHSAVRSDTFFRHFSTMYQHMKSKALFMDREVMLPDQTRVTMDQREWVRKENQYWWCANYFFLVKQKLSHGFHSLRCGRGSNLNTIQTQKVASFWYKTSNHWAYQMWTCTNSSYYLRFYSSTIAPCRGCFRGLLGCMWASDSSGSWTHFWSLDTRDGSKSWVIYSIWPSNHGSVGSTWSKMSPWNWVFWGTRHTYYLLK